MTSLSNSDKAVAAGSLALACGSVAYCTYLSRRLQRYNADVSARLAHPLAGMACGCCDSRRRSAFRA